MNDEIITAVEDFALQLSNLWDDTDLLNAARALFGTLYVCGQVVYMDRESMLHNMACAEDLVTRLRDWCDMTESAMESVRDTL